MRTQVQRYIQLSSRGKNPSDSQDPQVTQAAVKTLKNAETAISKMILKLKQDIKATIDNEKTPDLRESGNNKQIILTGGKTALYLRIQQAPHRKKKQQLMTV